MTIPAIALLLFHSFIKIPARWLGRKKLLPETNAMQQLARNESRRINKPNKSCL